MTATNHQHFKKCKWLGLLSDKTPKTQGAVTSEVNTPIDSLPTPESGDPLCNPRLFFSACHTGHYSTKEIHAILRIMSFPKPHGMAKLASIPAQELPFTAQIEYQRYCARIGVLDDCRQKQLDRFKSDNTS